MEVGAPRPAAAERKRVASGKRQRGVLSDLIGQEVGLYQDVLQFVLMSGGPSIGFEASEVDPLGQPNIAMTLSRVAASLMEDAGRIVLPSVSALMAAAQLPRTPVSSTTEDLPVIAPSPTTAGYAAGVEVLPSQFSAEQRAHYDDAVYFVTIATTQAAMDQVLEELSYHAVKRGILDALLYGMSLMCRYPVRSDLEDETGRPIREVMVQAAVNLFVNVDVLCDLQFLNATRGCRICDLIRWCVGTRKRPLLDLAVGLSVRVVHLCFPRLPADAEMPVMECTHYTDAVRRTYCGYEDCESVVQELAAMKRPETFQCFKDVMFLLDEARGYFVTAHPTATTAEEQQLVDKQHPWMVAGGPKDLHYISTVPLRALERWLGVSAEPERQMMVSEGDARMALVGMERDTRSDLKSTFVALHDTIAKQAAWVRVCLRAHEQEMSARIVVEEAYRERCDSIQDDLRRLRWHATHRPPLPIISRSTTTADGNDRNGSAAPAVMPRFYFLEVVSLETIESIEVKCREETARHQRYAFSAMREAWDMDLQWIHEMLAEAAHEKYLREEKRQEMLRNAEAMVDEEIAIARRLRGSALSTNGVTTRAASSTAVARRYPDPSAASPVPPTGNNSAFGPIGVYSGRGGLSRAASRAEPSQTPQRYAVSPTAPVPPMFHGYDYLSPHSTTPSSLGFGPKAPDLIARPTSMLRETPHNRREYLAQHRYGHGDDGGGVGIVVTTRVTSPSDVGPTASAGIRYLDGGAEGEEQDDMCDDEREAKQQQWSAAAISYFFFGRYQDLLDDQDIERGLVEDEEASLRKDLQQRLREGRLMQFDWSMSGYRRLITSYSRQQGASPRPGSSVLSSMSGASRLATFPLQPKAPDRHLPSGMRALRSGAASRSQQPSAAPLSPAPGYVVAQSSRPTSRLLQQLFHAEGPPAARYGAAGTPTPNAQFMPRQQSSGSINGRSTQQERFQGYQQTTMQHTAAPSKYPMTHH